MTNISLNKICYISLKAFSERDILSKQNYFLQLRKNKVIAIFKETHIIHTCSYYIITSCTSILLAHRAKKKLLT